MTNGCKFEYFSLKLVLKQFQGFEILSSNLPSSFVSVVPKLNEWKLWVNVNHWSVDNSQKTQLQRILMAALSFWTQLLRDVDLEPATLGSLGWYRQSDKLYHRVHVLSWDDNHHQSLLPGKELYWMSIKDGMHHNRIIRKWTQVPIGLSFGSTNQNMTIPRHRVPSNL